MNHDQFGYKLDASTASNNISVFISSMKQLKEPQIILLLYII